MDFSESSKSQHFYPERNSLYPLKKSWWKDNHVMNIKNMDLTLLSRRGSVLPSVMLLLTALCHQVVSGSSLEAQLVSGLSPLSRGRGCSDADSEGREVAPEPGLQPTAPGNWVFTTVLLQTSENTSSALQLGKNSLVEVLTEISKINLIARWWLWSDCWWDSPPHQPQASITIWQKQTDNGIK